MGWPWLERVALRAAPHWRGSLHIVQCAQGDAWTSFGQRCPRRSTLRLVDKGGDLLGGGEARAWRARCPGPLPAKLAMQAGRQGSWNGPRSLRAHHAQAQAVHHVAIAHGLVRDLSFAGEGPEREPGREPFEL